MPSNVSPMLTEGLFPLYDIANFFLGSIVQAQTLDAFLNRMQLTDFPSLWKSVQTKPNAWLEYFTGYMVLACLGAAIVLLLPLVGGIVFCCRCCCRRCGAQFSVKAKKRDRCQRVVCGIVLLVFSVLTTAGCVCMLLTNVQLWEETGEEEGMMDKLSSHFAGVDTYRNSTLADIDEHIVNRFTEGKNAVFTVLDDGPVTMTNRLGVLTDVTPVANALVTFTDSLYTIRSALWNVQNKTSDLQVNGSYLSTELATLRSEIRDDATLCASTTPSCQVILNNVGELDTEADYQRVGDVNVALAGVDYVINDGIIDAMHKGVEAFNNISNVIREAWGQPVSIAKVEMNNIESNVHSETAKMTEQVRALQFTEAQTGINNAKSTVKSVGNYRFYTSVVLACILVLIVLCYYTGLSFGACGKSECAMETGSRCLLAGIGFSIIFGWIVMVLTIAMFLTGGLAYTEGCRYLIDLETSPTVATLDAMLQKTLNFSVSVQQVTLNCRSDVAAYSAFDLEKLGFNITEVVDLDNYDIRALLDGIKAVPIDMGTVTILDSDTNETLKVLDTGLNTIDFNSYRTEMSKNFAKFDLIVMASDLEQAASDLDVITLADSLRAHAAKLRELEQNVIQSMEEDKTLLGLSLDSVQSAIALAPLPTLTLSLSQAQDDLNSRGNSLLRDILHETVDSIAVILTDLMTAINTAVRFEVGQCKLLYESFNGMINVGCKDFLDPYNGFWLSSGWSLFLMVPSVVIAMHLSVLYRKHSRQNSVAHLGSVTTLSTEYNPAPPPDYEMFDQSPQGGYTQTSDSTNI